MINCVIIDDEPKAITSLKWELDQCDYPVTVLETFTDAEKAITFLKYNSVDFIFLDVEMPTMDGFNFLEKFQQRDFEVIFVTAHDEYAINAIKEKALDYLLKPVESEDLMVCIQKIFAERQRSNLESKGSKMITLPLEKKLIFLNPDDIAYCKSDGNYTEVVKDAGEKILFSKKLKFIESLLPASDFFRIHNSYIINLKKIAEYHRSDNIVKLQNKVSIPIARSKKVEFLQKL